MGIQTSFLLITFFGSLCVDGQGFNISSLETQILEILPSIVDEASREQAVDETVSTLFCGFGVDTLREEKVRSPERIHNSFLRGNARSRLIKTKGVWYQSATRGMLGSLKQRFGTTITRNNLLQMSQQPVLANVVAKLSGINPECPFNDRIECNFFSRFRTADGTCNNILDPVLGAAERPFRRFLPAFYGDLSGRLPRTRSVVRLSSGRRQRLSSARLVSRVVHENSRPQDAFNTITHMVMQWGQFIDHDLTLAPITQGVDGSEINCCEFLVRRRIGRRVFDRLRRFGGLERRRSSNGGACFPIFIPSGDTAFNRTCMNFVRSSPSPNRYCQFGPREQLNRLTAFVDGSMIYGSSLEEQESLRLENSGKLKFSNGPDGLQFLPFFLNIEQNICFAPNPEDPSNNQCFIAGDERVNEQPGLTAMHTLWLREHNRIAEFFHQNTMWSNEKIFEEARRIVSAEVQVITFKDFLPLVLGDKTIDKFNLRVLPNGHFNGYNPNVDATIRNEFATAAYRFGHSLIRDIFTRVNTDFRSFSSNSDLLLRENFNSPSVLNDISQGGPEGLLRGLINATAQRFDRRISQELSEHLFEDRNTDGTIRNLGLDLPALNIQRGRDHGIAPYTVVRRFCGLGSATSFSDLSNTHNSFNIDLLRQVYSDVRDVDLFTGATTERPLPGAIVAPTFACLIGRQFDFLKRGDRFYFENGPLNNPKVANTNFNLAQLATLRDVTLSGVLCDNKVLPRVQPNAFRTPSVSGNSVKSCLDIPQLDLTKFL